MRSYLIKIEEKSLPFIALPQQFRVRLGQTGLAIGSPEGLDHTVPKGIVSAVGRQPERDRPMVYVQTAAPWIRCRNSALSYICIAEMCPCRWKFCVGPDGEAVDRSGGRFCRH